MPFTTRRRQHVVTTTAPRRRGLFSRRAAPARTTHHHTHTAAPVRHTHAAAPVHHHKRRPSMKDKISGALTRMKGSLTRRPGVKAAGTRRMRGTDGRGSRHARRRMF